MARAPSRSRMMSTLPTPMGHNSRHTSASDAASTVTTPATASHVPVGPQG